MSIKEKPVFCSEDFEKIYILNEVLRKNEIKTVCGDNVVGKVIYVSVNDYQKALEIGLEYVCEKQITGINWITHGKHIQKIEKSQIIRGGSSDNYFEN